MLDVSVLGNLVALGAKGFSMSRYKKKMLVGFCLSCLSVMIGIGILQNHTYSAIGVTFVVLGGFTSFFFAMYYVGTYEGCVGKALSFTEITTDTSPAFEESRDNK